MRKSPERLTRSRWLTACGRNCLKCSPSTRRSSRHSEALTSAATEEGHNEHARFAQKLILHARTEEEVLYPAAILLGEYLKLKGKA